MQWHITIISGENFWNIIWFTIHKFNAKNAVNHMEILGITDILKQNDPSVLVSISINVML